MDDQNQLPQKLVSGATARAAAISRLCSIPQVEGELVIIDAQSSLLAKWTTVYAKLFDSCFLLFAKKNDDVPTSVFMVEDAFIKYNTSDLGSMVLNSSIATPHTFSLCRPATGRKVFISARDGSVRDAWIQALLSTGTSSVISDISPL
jgi:hypothetical protein|tara:strand:+ start:87 stop:530 length:444 start_codon:yes stop_codon:yes gene_type:complete